MARTRDEPRGRYSQLSLEPFGDDFYHTRRRTGRLPMLTEVPANVYKTSVTKFGRRRGPALLYFCCLAFLLSTYALHQRFVSSRKVWPVPWRGSKTAVFGRDDSRKVWDWEVRSGHYPSTRSSECFPRLPAFPYSTSASMPTRSSHVLIASASRKFLSKWDSQSHPKTLRCRRA